MPEKSADITSVLGLIPSVYYDLIARVIPGLALVGALWGAGVKIPVELSGGVLGVLALLLGGYLAGMVMTPVSLIWDYLSFVLVSLLLVRQHGGWMQVTARMDLVGTRKVEAGGTLAKMMAETVLCENLLTVAVIGYLLSPQAWRVPGPLAFWRLEEWWIVAIVGLSINILFRQSALLYRLTSFEAT